MASTFEELFKKSLREEKRKQKPQYPEYETVEEAEKAMRDAEFEMIYGDYRAKNFGDDKEDLEDRIQYLEKHCLKLAKKLTQECKRLNPDIRDVYSNAKQQYQELKEMEKLKRAAHTW